MECIVQKCTNLTDYRSEHAYHHGTSPVQTVGVSSTRILSASNRELTDLARRIADIATLKQALLALVEHLRQSGVGALPLEAPPIPDPRSDDQLVSEATKAVQVL